MAIFQVAVIDDPTRRERVIRDYAPRLLKYVKDGNQKRITEITKKAVEMTESIKQEIYSDELVSKMKMEIYNAQKPEIIKPFQRYFPNRVPVVLLPHCE